MHRKPEMMQLRFDEIDQIVYAQNKILQRKQINKTLTQARHNAKRDTCFLCKKRCTSFAKSHSIPQFCLKRIALDGKLFMSGLQQEFPLLGEDTGVGAAGTFRLICHKCDNTRFQRYENPELYICMPSMGMIAEMALKNALRNIAVKREELEHFRILIEKDKTDGLSQQQIDLLPIDIAQYTEMFRYAKVAAEQDKDDRYSIIFYAKLPYVVPLAFQDTIALISDFEDNVINDIYRKSTSYKLQELEIVVFPLQESSIVLVYTDRRNKKYDRFSAQLQALSFSDQLAAINFIIFSYSENVFVSKTLADTVMKDPHFLSCCQTSTIGVSDAMGADYLASAIIAHSLSQRSIVPNLLSEMYALDNYSH